MKRLQFKFATDTVYTEAKSMHQNTCAQIYSTKEFFSVCYPIMKSDAESIRQTLEEFSHDFVVPQHLNFGGVQYQVGRNTNFVKTIKRLEI